MKGLILAGGAGTRLRPITHTSAKQLVPVANKPILFYGIEGMADAGIKEIGIIVGDTRDEVIEAVGDGSNWGVKVTYIPQDAPLGLAHCVLIAEGFLAGDDFVMYLGDNMLQQGLKQFVDGFEADRERARNPQLGEAIQSPSAQILLAQVDDPRSFGVADIDPDGRVVQLVEKPADPPSNLALVGVYLFDAEILDAVKAIEPSERGELEITDAIQWLIDQGRRVRHEVLEGWWLDTGKKDPLLESNMKVLDTLETSVEGQVDEPSKVDGRVVIAAGAQLVNSTVRGPAIIGANTYLENTYVGPYTSIAADCRIVNTEIEHSVVLEHSTLEGIPRIADSLIGRHVNVRRSAERPRATRLMLGDHCDLDIE
jgi:glucose-1-phosphate thymidylyltransferase